MNEIALRGKNEYNLSTIKRQRRDVLPARTRRLTHTRRVVRMCATHYCSDSPLDSQFKFQRSVPCAVGGVV